MEGSVYRMGCENDSARAKKYSGAGMAQDGMETPVLDDSGTILLSCPESVSGRQ